MANGHSLVERAEQTAERAERLLARADALVMRASGLRSVPAAAVDPPSLAVLEAILAQVANSGVSEITNQLLGWQTPLDEIAGKVESLMSEIAELPGNLKALSIAELEELADTVDDQIRDLIDTVQTAFSDTTSKVNDAVEATDQRLQELTGKARDTIQIALTDVQDILDTSRYEVDQIISTLEKSRQTVLTMCRSMGSGATSARPALDVAFSAFSAVS